MTRRAALGLALALPLAAGERVRVAAAEPVADTWMYAGNAARTGEFPGPGLDHNQDIVELWRLEGSRTGASTKPCGVCDGLAYYLPMPGGITAEIMPLIAVDAQTGSEVWQYDPPESLWGEPAISNGLLVMPTFSGLLVGLDARSGEERWVFDLQGTCNQSRPAIVDDVVYISDTASVNAINLGDTPEWLWKAPFGDGSTTLVSGTVSVDGGYVVVSSASPVSDSYENAKSTNIHVLNETDGAEAYRYQFRSEGESHQFAVQDGMIYSRTDTVGSPASYLFSMSIDGTERWSERTSLDAVPAYPAVSGDLVYFTGGNSVWGLDAATGQTVWTSPPLQMLQPDIVQIDGVLYVGAAPPTPMLYALSAVDGTLLGSIEAPFNGAHVIGITDGVLIARSGVNLVAFANLR